jgi:hypothetical protein
MLVVTAPRGAMLAATRKPLHDWRSQSVSPGVISCNSSPGRIKPGARRGIAAQLNAAAVALAMPPR